MSAGGGGSEGVEPKGCPGVGVGFGGGGGCWRNVDGACMQMRSEGAWAALCPSTSIGGTKGFGNPPIKEQAIKCGENCGFDC